MKKAIGIDIGGTKIAGAVVSADGSLTHLVHQPTDTSSAQAVFEQLLAVIESVCEQEGCSVNEFAGIGIGLPGKADRAAGIAVFQNNLPWDNFPVVAKLKEHYPELNIVIDNDVAMSAYGEYFTAEVEPGELLSYVTISTGIAAASIVDGQHVLGAGFSGELGMTRVYSALDQAYMRLEEAVAGPAIARHGQQLIGRDVQETKDVFDLYAQGNAEAERIIESVTQTIAYAIDNMISLLDPHYIIFGGSVMEKNPWLVAMVAAALDDTLLPAQKDAISRLRISQNKGQHGLIGAGSRVL